MESEQDITKTKGLKLALAENVSTMATLSSFRVASIVTAPYLMNCGKEEFYAKTVPYKTPSSLTL